MSKADTVAFEYAKENGTIGLDYNEIYDAVKYGYHQAEKDLELTNADVYDIWRIYNEVCAEGEIFGFDETSQEVLKRFKNMKK